MFVSYESPILIIVWIVGSVFVGRCAPAFKRNSLGWFALSVLFSPVAGIVFLLVADVPHQAMADQEREESVRRRHGEAAAEEVREMARFEAECPHCSARVNAQTGEGVQCSEEGPEVVRCSSCDEPLPVEFLYG